LKRPKLTVNVYKVLFGVAFSLVWARVMYAIWAQPSYATFIWFYLGVGSVLLKWVFFESIDRLHRRLRRRAIEKQLAESVTRLDEATSSGPRAGDVPSVEGKMPSASIHVTVRDLEDDVLQLGAMVETAIRRSLEALRKGDMDLATSVVADDRLLDQAELAIRNKCIGLISEGALNVADTRSVVSVLGVITELERMGDYGDGIAKIALMIGEQPPPEQLPGVTAMGDWGVKMLQESLKSLSGRDVELAERVCRMDDEMDSLYDQSFRALLLMIIEDPASITRATWIVWAAHNLERFADRATNICEWVVFAESGQMLDIGASRY